ncbi:MAG: glycoside hydrolase family 65 protein [Flavobacteriales bacterium]|nr:glycoside hydrolase family 65 protein [Flavobacteriales bacterium]
MKNFLEYDEWLIVEEGFHKPYHKVSESVFSIGNGKIGQRANFEEYYSGETLNGSYVAGVYYPDKTKVGWWKNGYPEYFAKVPNSTNWIGLNLKLNGETLDLNVMEILKFRRVLDMKNGLLRRNFTLKLSDGNFVEFETERFCSMSFHEIGVVNYKLKPLNSSVNVEVESYLDGNILNEDANYGESFWDAVESSCESDEMRLTIKTRKTEFTTSTACKTLINAGGTVLNKNAFTQISEPKFTSVSAKFTLKTNETCNIFKFVSVLSSLDCEPELISDRSGEYCLSAFNKGYVQLRSEHCNAWEEIWKMADIKIQGDVKAQQAIRFNIFHLYQTYTGEDYRLNIGPKGFTGEKYGGSTYWDTEAYCLPFYLSTAKPEVARNLLMYRYNHLNKAIENAEKLGFKKGAALYPMVTMNGEECHNEWEITFEEIHRNGAIAYAIFDYVRYTADFDYVLNYGLEVLIAISRFWAQRVHWSANKNKYVMLGVTGPNEFENNVNNNWYTNKIATWTLSYTLECIHKTASENSEIWNSIQKKCSFDRQKETAEWRKIIDTIYYPYDETLGIFLQQDGFMDKEQLSVEDLKNDERPIVEHWSWDKILRSIFIKQADVLQGFYFFEDEFDLETLKRHYDFYEPKTVHESSLSPCVHSILAAKIGYSEKAYSFYLQTSRLDLDDYNNDTRDGLHITSMAGTWLAIVKGFAGMKVVKDELHFKPFLPPNWRSFSFRLNFRNALFEITINENETKVEQISGKEVIYKVNTDFYKKKEQPDGHSLPN